MSNQAYSKTLTKKSIKHGIELDVQSATIRSSEREPEDIRNPIKGEGNGNRKGEGQNSESVKLPFPPHGRFKLGKLKGGKA